MADRRDKPEKAHAADEFATLAPGEVPGNTPPPPGAQETIAQTPATEKTGEKTPPADIYATMAREIPAGASAASIPSGGAAATGLPFDRVGEYDILGKIGHGGMGLVLKARQRGLKRVVALKMIKVGQLAEETEIARFLVEARAAAHLKHPNIVAVYDVGEHAGSPFFSMEYVEGQSLHKLISERPLQPQRAAVIIQKLALAVNYAHEAGILHRDLKPQNILLDKYEEPKITDFGLASSAQENSQLTATGTVLGTPSYMPPEQARGRHEEMGNWSDIYSLGATLYEALVGRPPFSAATLGETLQQVMSVDPVSPRTLNPAIPRDIETICLKCLEKSPARRYQTGQELADELQRFLEDRPILASPTSRTEKFVRWCRRNPVIAGAAAAVSVAAIVAIISLWIGLSQAIAAKTEADETAQDAMEMVDQLMVRISGETLLNQPGMQEVRVDIQTKALASYEKLLTKLERNQRLPLQIAMVRYQMGRIKQDLDGPKEALTLYETAEKSLAQLLKAEPDNLPVLKMLSAVQTERGGLLYRQGDYQNATELLQSAVKHRERVVQLDPENIESGALLANAEMNLGLLEEMKQNPRKALDLFLAAESRRQGLLARDPENALLLRGHGKGFYNLGAFHSRHHDLAKAEQAFEQSRMQFQKLCARQVPDYEDMHELAMTWGMLGNIAMVQDSKSDFARAAERYSEAIKVLGELLSRNTAVNSYWELMVQTQMNLALVRERQDRGSEAFELLKAAFYAARELRTVNTKFSTVYAKTLYEMLRMRKWKKLSSKEESELVSLLADASGDYGEDWLKSVQSQAADAAEFPKAQTLEETDLRASSTAEKEAQEKPEIK